MKSRRTSEIERAFEILAEECENKHCGEKLKSVMQCKCGHDVFREWFTRVAGDIVLLPNASMWTITLKRDILDAGNLKAFDLKNSKRAIARIINKQNISGLKAIGYLDIELQEPIDINESTPAIWLMHYHFIVISNFKLKKVRRIMRKRFHRMRHNVRPLMIKSIDKSRFFNFDYFIKYPWEMKKKLRDRSGNQIETQMRIKGKRRQELNRFLLRSPLIKWIFLIGWRRASGMLIDLSRSS